MTYPFSWWAVNLWWALLIPGFVLFGLTKHGGIKMFALLVIAAGIFFAGYTSGLQHLLGV